MGECLLPTRSLHSPALDDQISCLELSLSLLCAGILSLPTPPALPLPTSSLTRVYDSQALIEYIEGLEAKPVIPVRAGHIQPRPYDTALYKQRNWSECTFNRLKHWRTDCNTV